MGIDELIVLIKFLIINFEFIGTLSASSSETLIVNISLPRDDPLEYMSHSRKYKNVRMIINGHITIPIE